MEAAKKEYPSTALVVSRTAREAVEGADVVVVATSSSSKGGGFKGVFTDTATLSAGD